MAGIYDVRDVVPCYCILTTAPNASMRDVHDRMPLVLEHKQIVPWLYDLKATEQFLKATPRLFVLRRVRNRERISTKRYSPYTTNVLK